MKDRTYEDALRTIRKLDKRTENERASRLQELGVMFWSSVERSTSRRMDDYSSEASMNYVNGSFRSCIFCCSAAVDQIFRHEIIHKSENPEKKMDKIRGKPFGHIMPFAEKVERLQFFLDDARWLNTLRNTVAVHPLSFWPLQTCIEDEKRKKDVEMANIVIVQDLTKIITAADDEDAEMIRQQFIIREDGIRVVLADVLADPTSPEAYDLLMWQIDNDVLKPLALKAYQRMAGIIEGLYPAEY
jgi:hypothetical protein